MKLGQVAGAVGKGLFAGVVGTAAMTVSSTIEARMSGREASSAPADAAGKVLGVQPRNPEGRERFSTAVHWGYGTGWGAARGLLAATGLQGRAATTAHFATVWGTSMVMLPRLGVAPPVTQWGPQQLATDAFHHAVYAVATSVAYRFIDRH
ncbi:MAG: hypothetical protein H0W82_05700 [Actinobacteria bacterium]|nr:hypothetical protein [Actinomycetota bacterium]